MAAADSVVEQLVHCPTAGSDAEQAKAIHAFGTLNSLSFVFEPSCNEQKTRELRSNALVHACLHMSMCACVRGLSLLSATRLLIVLPPPLPR